MERNVLPEVKVGVTALLTIIIFIWLFSFLKGQNLLNTSDKYYILYEDIAGLEESNYVEINGFKAGVVHDVELLNDGTGQLLVTINLIKDYRIPINSIAEITPSSLITGMKIQIVHSEESTWYNNGDTIPGRLAISILDKIETGFDPIMAKTESLVVDIDTMVRRINRVLTPVFSEDIKNSAENLEGVSEKLDGILSQKEGEINQLIFNLEKFSKMMAENTGNIDTAISNLATISDSLANAQLTSSVGSLKSTLDETTFLLKKLNKGDGSAGLFLNDDSLYLNLANSMRNLNDLILDLKENPKKYVHFSVFGKNQK